MNEIIKRGIVKLFTIFNVSADGKYMRQAIKILKGANVFFISRIYLFIFIYMYTVGSKLNW